MTRVHATDGSLVAEYARERRLYLPIQAIPKLVLNAFIAAEDKNFYEHGGLDFRASPRAALFMAQNYGTGRRPQGASTITQQVAKNFLLTNEASFERKIKEALLALKIERTYSKEKILELYLNEIYLGLRRLWRRGRVAPLFRQVGARADRRRGRLSRGAAEGAEQLSSVPPARARDRAPQLRARPHGRGSATSSPRKARRRRRTRSPSRRARPARTSSRRNISPRKCAATSTTATAKRSCTKAACRCAPRSIPSCR